MRSLIGLLTFDTTGTLVLILAAAFHCRARVAIFLWPVLTGRSDIDG